mgnify:CR=1 FL=1
MSEEQTDVVRIARGLLEGVKEFSKSGKARRRGLLSYADVINEAVRDYLEKMKVLPH